MTRMTAAQYRAAVQGKVNRAQGLAFEDTIESACKYYMIAGRAYIEKTPEPMKIIKALDRKKGIFAAVFQKAAQPDYKGTMAGGRAVAFEAKHTETDRILQSAVTDDQRDALDKHEAMGAICFVLVSLGYKYHRVPWTVWKTMKDHFGHKYMNAADLASYEIPYRAGILRFLEPSPDSKAAQIYLNAIQK